MKLTSAVLETERIQLNPVSMTDTKDIQENARVREIADTMISIPYPYPPDGGTRYVDKHLAEFETGTAVSFILRNRSSGRFLGIVELRAIETEHSQGELSFWLAKHAWGKGYMQEALSAVVEFAFESVGLNRLYAYHMLRNPASGRILEKTGFRREGVLCQRVRKWNIFEDVALWAILRRDWKT